MSKRDKYIIIGCILAYLAYTYYMRTSAARSNGEDKTSDESEENGKYHIDYSDFPEKIAHQDSSESSRTSSSRPLKLVI